MRKLSENNLGNNWNEKHSITRSLDHSQMAMKSKHLINYFIKIRTGMQRLLLSKFFCFTLLGAAAPNSCIFQK